MDTLFVTAAAKVCKEIYVLSSLSQTEALLHFIL